MRFRVGRRAAANLAVLGLLLMGTAACSAAGDPASDSGSRGVADRDSAAQPPAAGAEKGQPGAPAPAGAGAPPPGGAPDSGGPDQRVDQRAIIYTGSMQVRVEDVDRAAADTIGLITSAGGYVGGDQRSGEGASREATLEVRVPAARFTGVVDQISGLGKQLRRDVKTEDVTLETVDLAARIATQRARVESGRKLLAKAKTLSELVELENEVAKRQADLAALEAKQRRLADLTTLSTITVSLVRTEPPPPPAPAKAETGFLAGLKSGWTGLLATVTVLLTVLGVLLPWLVTFGVPVLLVVWLVRRRRRSAVGAPGEQAVPGEVAAPGGAGAPGQTTPVRAGVPGGVGTPGSVVPGQAGPVAAPPAARPGTPASEPPSRGAPSAP